MSKGWDDFRQKLRASVTLLRLLPQRPREKAPPPAGPEPVGHPGADDDEPGTGAPPEQPHDVPPVAPKRPSDR